MQRSDAEKVVSELVGRSRKQRDALLKELERVAKRARREVGRPAAAAPAARSAMSRTGRSRRRTACAAAPG